MSGPVGGQEAGLPGGPGLHLKIPNQPPPALRAGLSFIKSFILSLSVNQQTVPDATPCARLLAKKHGLGITVFESQHCNFPVYDAQKITSCL